MNKQNKSHISSDWSPFRLSRTTPISGRSGYSWEEVLSSPWLDVLKEECSADAERIQRVKRSLQRLYAQTYQLLDLLSWCSPLGQLFVRMRRSLPSKGGRPAQATMERLAANGVSSVEQLHSMDLGAFKKMGIRKDIAGKILSYLSSQK